VEGEQHINALELKAAYLALQSFLSQMDHPPRHILLELDNTTAMAYLKKMGGGGTTLQLRQIKLYKYGNMC
jgi:hypothetical protein